MHTPALEKQLDNGAHRLCFAGEWRHDRGLGVTQRNARVGRAQGTAIL
jgi:hypothetical protein